MEGNGDSGRFLLIDCDPGLDDCVAIMMALSRYPRVKTVAITCVRGNVGLQQVTLNAMRIVKACGMLEKVPVFKGCVNPIISTPHKVDSTFYHGKDGLGDSPDVEPRADEKLHELVQKEHAVDAIIRLSKEYEGKLQIVAIAPLTNLAMAVRLDPDLPKRLRSLHILGGTFRGYGNVTPAAEYNFFTDPEAAHITIQEYSRFCPVQLTTYEVTSDHATPAAWHLKWVSEDNNPKRRFFREVYRDAAKKEEQAISEEEAKGYTICDAYAMCAALDPSSVKRSKHAHVGIELGGNLARGSLVIDHMKKGSPHLCESTVEIVETFDMAKFQNMLTEALK